MSFPPNLMTLADLTPSQINQVVGLARRLKFISRRVLPPMGPTMRDAAWKESTLDPTKLSAPPQSLRNMSIALLFSKRSTRTRVASETATKLLGGQAIFLGKDDIQLGVNESARDTCQVLSRMCQGIFARVGDHSEIEELAQYATVPVINALSSLWHPTQVLADLQTLYEERSLQQEPTPAPSQFSIPYSSTAPSVGETVTSESTEQLEQPASSTSDAAAAKHRISRARRRLRPLKIAYVGDSANVLHDMLVTYPRLGHKLQVASPQDARYRAPAPVWDRVVELGCDKQIEWTSDPREAVKDADVVVTDTWVSMGQEAEYEQRVRDFQGYQVTEALCENAKKDWRFMHCLPRKSHEVDDDVFYGPRSLVFREAENRKWTIMALFHIMFGGGSFNALPHGRQRPLYQPSIQVQKVSNETVSMTTEQLAYLNTRMNTVLETARKLENRLKRKGKPNQNVQSDKAGGEAKASAETEGEATVEKILSAVEKEVEAVEQAKQQKPTENKDSV